MRWAGLLFLSSCVVGCGTATAVDAGVDARVDAATLDARLEPPTDVGNDALPDTYCFPSEVYSRFTCSDGRISEWSCTTPCHHCTSFERTDVSCPNGCRADPVQFPQVPEDVCAPFADVGSPCATDDDCAPAVSDDGYGGPATPRTLHCDTGHGACASDHEDCNTADDDLDGTIDEGCTCVPRTIVFSGISGFPGEAALGGERILVSTWSDLGSSLALTDADGVQRSSYPVAGSSLSRIDGAFLYLESGASTGTGAIRRIGDDGRRIGTTTSVSWPAGWPTVGEWGADLVLVAPLASGSWSIARIGADGTTLASGTFDAADRVRLASLADGTPLVIDGAASSPIRLLAAASDATTHEVADVSADHVGPASEVVRTADRLWITARDVSGAVVLAAIDPSTGAWAETLSLGAITTSPSIGGVEDPVVHLAARGEHLFASWRDLHGALRTVVIDTTGARLGESTLPLEGPAYLYPGGTDAGVRVVAGVRLLAPCDAL